MSKNLNILYNYKISHSVRYAQNHVTIMRNNPITDKDDWEKGCFEVVKQYIKKTYYREQNLRCAYCRRKLNTDAYYDHIDHILPRVRYKKWMFKPKNLVVACGPCNSLKNDDDTLSVGWDRRKFPNTIAGFIIYNPHYSEWREHFRFEDGFF